MRATTRWLALPILLMGGVLVSGMAVDGARAQELCVGDCNDDGEVTIDDLLKVVNVSAGTMPQDACTAADGSADGQVLIDEVIRSVRGALYGCNCVDDPVVFSSTFEGIQKQIFERRGCTAEVCHGASPGEGGLDLRPEVAYDNIFEKPSTVGMNLITPGARDRSYLFLKLAAATDPTQLNGFEISGSPMPNGLEPLTPAELELVRLWIYNGATENDIIPGTDELLGACLPPPKPITIDPLPPPAVDEGVQFVMPPWDLPATSEFEGCFATYYDFTDQVPEEFKDSTGRFFRWRGFEVRQDPQSHHLLLYYSPLNVAPEGLDPNHEAFGTWTCKGGPTNGAVCDPKNLTQCGEGGVCSTELLPSFACVGFGPPSRQPAEITGGAPQAQTNFVFPAGAYQQLPLKGVMYWNTHAFNITNVDHIMNGRVNYYFASAENQVHQTCRISNFSAIFRPNNPPFTRETYCNDHVFPIGARVFQIFGHNHKHGERFWVTDPAGELIYDNYSYSDPVIQVYEPALEFDSPDRAQRTVRYCATYNNGVGPDGEPDFDLVTRASRVPPVAEMFIGKCNPVACVAGKVTEACTVDADCDTAPGAGDGWCDACNITGGESTENEMFVLFGGFYVDRNVPDADLSCVPYPEEEED